MRKLLLLLLLAPVCAISLRAQVYSPDVDAKHFRNPIIYADYSDPDVCRVGNDYYMTSSSFNSVPGLQILHSTDLVHWSIIDAALPNNVPGTAITRPLYGCCVWAPSIREHDGMLYIFYGDPDRGIYMVRGNIGHWEEPILVKSGYGLIDPCPLWDEDGRVYLVHAYAGSRAGIKSVLAVCELSPEADKVISEDRIVFDGHINHPTCEGPKFYKRNGYYYIFTPAGGVSTGWQLVLRSSSPYGPFEEKIVLAQGRTDINGPHQGAWVETDSPNADGVKDWFFHFQDVGVYGRIVHLQPLRWHDDWPVIGEDKDADGCGQPVKKCLRPNLPLAEGYPAESDEFTSSTLGLQWQWATKHLASWYFCDAQNGILRLYSVPSFPRKDTVDNKKKQGHDVYYPNLLLQKTPAEQFTVTARVRFSPAPKLATEKAGLIVTGRKSFEYCVPAELAGEWVYLRVRFSSKAECTFSMSTDQKKWTNEQTFQAVEGQWIGCKVGLFCTRTSIHNDSGWLDVDWFRITK